MKRSIVLFAYASLVLGCATLAPGGASAADCTSPTGSWSNQLGSKLVITGIANGLMSGKYQTATGAGGWFPLTGWLNQQAPDPPKDHVQSVVSFTVRWGDVGSITAWAGTCELRKLGANRERCTVADAVCVPTITTLWHLVRPNSEFEWDHVLTNTDVFTPVAGAANE